jgi:hypothetical protein
VPPVDVIKINIDGSFLESSNTVGWGAIGRDHIGDVVFAACGQIPAAAEALQTELQALVSVISVAEQLGIRRVIFSTECTELKLAIEAQGHCSSPAHRLAALGGVWNHGNQSLWLHDFPPDVMSLVANVSVGA